LITLILLSTRCRLCIADVVESYKMVSKAKCSGRIDKADLHEKIASGDVFKNLLHSEGGLMQTGLFGSRIDYPIRLFEMTMFNIQKYCVLHFNLFLLQRCGEMI